MGHLRAAVGLAALLALAGCATAPPRASLYEALGGQPGVEALVEEFVVRLVQDRRIAHHFEGVDLINLNDRLVEQVCAEAGGPCTYSGRSMAESHAGLGITEADFNALVEDLQAAMQARGIDRRSQFRLLRRLAPMHRDIVTP